MTGFIVDAGHARGSATRAAERSAPPFEPGRGGRAARILWEASAPRCAECGEEVAPATAYRSSARAVYCSLEHAQRDLE